MLKLSYEHILKIEKINPNEQLTPEQNKNLAWHACALGQYEVIQALSGANHDWSIGDCYGNTPLWKACQNGHLEIVRLLLENGAITKDAEHMAKSKGHHQIAMLIKTWESMPNEKSAGKLMDTIKIYAQGDVVSNIHSHRFFKPLHIPFGKHYIEIVSKALESMKPSDDESDLRQLIGLMKYYAEKERVDLRAYPNGTVAAFLNVAEILLKTSFADIPRVEPSPEESVTATNIIDDL